MAVREGERTVRGGSLPAEQCRGVGWGVMMHSSCSHAPFPSFYCSLLSARCLTVAGDPKAAGLGGAQDGMRTALPAGSVPAGAKVGRGRGSRGAAGSGEVDPVLLCRAISSSRERCHGHQLTRGLQPRGAAPVSPCPEPQAAGQLFPVPAPCCLRG